MSSRSRGSALRAALGLGRSHREGAFRFQDHENEASAFAALQALLPKGSPLSTIEKLMDDAGADCFSISPSNVVACRLIEGGFFEVGAMWSVAFELDGARRLQAIRVTRGVTGP